MSLQVTSIVCIHLELKWAAVWPRLRQRKGGFLVEGGHQSLRLLSPLSPYYSGLQDAVLNVLNESSQYTSSRYTWTEVDRTQVLAI